MCNQPARVPDPSLEEIAAATAKIRAKWTPEVYMVRSGKARNVMDAKQMLQFPYRFPVVRWQGIGLAE